MRSLRLMLPGLFLAMLFFTASAFAQDVSFNFDKTADFTKYKTYHWEKHPQSADVDQLTATQLGAALEAELTKKGLTKKESGPTDMVIVYQLAVKNDKELNTFSSGYGMGPGWGGGWYGAGGTGTSTTTVTNITIGTLGLDMYDATSKTLVWRGIATKTLDTGAKPDKRTKNMAKASEKLLKNYPPVVKK